MNRYGMVERALALADYGVTVLVSVASAVNDSIDISGAVQVITTGVGSSCILHRFSQIRPYGRPRVGG
jgi:hypothetical protein